MSTLDISPLEEVIRQSGEGWVIDWFTPKEKAVPHLRQTLALIDQRAKERLGANAPDVSEDAIIAEYHRNPQKVRAFFQALGGTRTPDMLLMVWRIMQGMEVKEIQMTYHRKQSFEIRVVLQSPYGDEDAAYTSTSIFDFALLCQVGTHEVSGLPVFDGFYALKVRDQK